MICSNCGHNVRESAKFCDECGIVLPVSSPDSGAQPRPGPSASVAPRRVEPYRSSVEGPTDGQPSGATMLPPDNAARARRTFVIVAFALILILCCCCGTAAVSLYYLSQNAQTQSLFIPGAM